jgi:hypothetical protein
MSANEHIDELLSGFLDGKLSAGELRELERAMAGDASLGMKLDQFRQLGSDLRKVPQRHLGPDFAERVLAAARQEANASGSPAMAYVVGDLPSPQRELPVGDRGKVRMLSALLALAATLLCAIYLSGGFSGFGEQLAQGPISNDSSAVLEPEKALESEPKVADSGSESVGSFVGSDRGFKDRVGGKIGPQILTILEIQPTAEAWGQNLVAKVLQESGITWSSPIKASQEIMDVLNDTRSINQGLENPDDDQIALVLVKARASVIDKASSQLWTRTNDFPSLFFDMAFDLPGMDLVQKLTSAQGLANETEKPMATPIVVSDRTANGLAGISEFSSAPRKNYAAKAEREQASGFPEHSVSSGVGANEEDELSILLLVIRKPTP